MNRTVKLIADLKSIAVVLRVMCGALPHRTPYAVMAQCLG